MKNKFIIILLCIVANNTAYTDELQSLPAACTQECISSFGDITGVAPSGVTAYSNCSSACVNPEPNFVDGVFTGIKWQCVEYARRWLLMNKEVVYGDVDIAADIWSLETVHSSDKEQNYTFTSILNGTSNTNLQRGDLLIYAKAFLGTGHVAVVLSVDETKQTITVGEQNYTNKIWQQESAREIKYIVDEQQLWVLDPYLIGWKRVKK